MELLKINLEKKEKGFVLSIESDDEEILDYWGAKLLAFASGECTCNGCNCSCGCGNGDSCSCEED